MGNFKRRLERLEHGRKRRGIPIINVEPGESTEEAWQKYLAQHPEAEKAKVRIIFDESDQGPPGAPPPPRPESKGSAKAPGPGILQITK